MDKATMRDLRRFNMKLLGKGDLYDEDDVGHESSGNGGGDRVVPTLCSTCGYLASQYGASAEGSELRDKIIGAWSKHVHRFHPENEALSKSIATLEALRDANKH